MTQVAMIFEEEKQQAVNQAVNQAVEAERKKAADSEQQTVIKMIKKGYSSEDIVFFFSNYSIDDVEVLRKKMKNK